MAMETVVRGAKWSSRCQGKQGDSPVRSWILFWVKGQTSQFSTEEQHALIYVLKRTLWLLCGKWAEGDIKDRAS